MSPELWILMGTAAGVGFVHTVLGPDHYLPFVALSRARGWSLRRTLGLTALCGGGHVGSSVMLGLVGIAAGLSLHRLEFLESERGRVASWLLITFGLVYGTWGLVQARRGHRHAHVHGHADGTVHAHLHSHEAQHLHPHPPRTGGWTPWLLFVVFVFGPCEALIPLLMFPAAAMSMTAVFLVAAVFGAVTVATMMGIVGLAVSGLRRFPDRRFEGYGHALAGLVVLICGVGIQLGW